MASIPDFHQTADLYFQAPNTGMRKSISYRRFATLAEAVSFAMEDLSTRNRNSCILEFGRQRLRQDEIRALYQQADFPPRFKRKGVKT
jgi:hypothetical protein